MNFQYRYKAIVKKVYDADTVWVNISTGFRQWTLDEPIRLFGINAPELRGEQRPAGLRSRDALRAKLPVGTEIVLETIKDKKGKYGRYLGVVWLQGRNVNKWLVRKGYAEEKEY